MILPIHEVKDQLLENVGGAPDPKKPWRVLVKAPTGSGKSTGLPSMLLDAGVEGKIVVVQPRRIAARMLARRVAELRGGRLGGEVGYVVRFDNKTSVDSRIVYVTDGILQRWLEENPLLEGIGAVIFDEFHERRLAMDIALADCLNLQESLDLGRPDLKVCVMSATLEVAGLEEYLEPCRLIEAGGRSYPVEITYQHALAKSKTSNRYGNGEEPVWEKCVRAVMEAVTYDDCGNILIFLPGVYEIQKTITLLEQKKLTSRSGSGGGKWEICALYGTLKPEEQDRAVRDGGGPRIIVSTNVAETSLTIPGVCMVIDAGLARISEFDAVRGMDTLFVHKISRAAADQRAGRAGRVAPGRCIRLWSQADHGRRAEFELPEVRRVDMTETALKLKARGISDLSSFRWLEAPSELGLQHALELLGDLGATGDGDGQKITALGKSMAAMPLHPREARFLMAANGEKCLAEAIFTIALMQTDSGGGGIFMKGQQSGRSQFVYDDDTTDFAADHRAYVSAVAMQFTPQRCSGIGVMARVAREVQQAVQQLEKLTTRLGWDGKMREADFTIHGESFSRAMLVAYGDRVAVRTGAGNLSCRITGGRSGKISAESAVKDAELFIVTSMTEVGARDITVHLGGCTEVLLETVRELRGKFLVEGSHAVYDEKIRRVVNREETRYQDLVITTKDRGGMTEDVDMDRAAALLAERVASGELKLKKWDGGVEQWIARLLSLREWMPELELPGFDEEDRAIALETICQGALGYKQIKDKEVMPALQSWLSAGQHAALDAYAPSRMKLSNGQNVKVKYEVGKPPFIALTVQRLYGVKVSPTVANGAVVVQTHICAPNQRPWQMTQDLEGFWKNGFEQMKKDLAGRYPKQNWGGG
ncbi:MAG: ATP-dependent helicase HrpB [Akkermansiaceae bacterium]